MKTPEQMEMETQAAKSVNILLIAQHFGYSFKGSGNTYIVKGSNGGLVLFGKTNSFYDYYAKKGGSTIDFVMQELNVGIRDAIRYINEFAGNEFKAEKYFRAAVPKKEKQDQQFQQLELPKRNFNHKRVFAYLTKTRGISKDIVSDMLHRQMLYESAEKHNAVFVAYDKDGNAKHGFIRGTITGVQYRGDAFGSDKEYGFSVEGNSDKLLVFEAPIDLLSYMSLGWQHEHLLALGGLFEAPILKYIEEHSGIRNVSFILDNDKRALAAVCKLSEAVEKHGLTIIGNALADEIKAAGVKDVNEYLLRQKGMEKNAPKAERKL